MCDKQGCANMKFIPDTDIQYFYNLILETRHQFQYRYVISNVPYIETTFEVWKQKLKLKDVVHSLFELLLVWYTLLVGTNHLLI